MKKEPDLFSVVPSDGTRGNGHRHTQETEHKETLFFTVKMAKHLQRLPRDVVEILKIYLDTVLCSGGSWAR